MKVERGVEGVMENGVDRSEEKPARRGGPPKYLNEDFFKAALEDGLRDMRIDIKRIVFAESNEGGGENYCSSIYRAKALYRSSKRQLDEELALIVKSIAITPATQFLQELAVYLREKIFYFDVLGRLEVLIGDGSKFGAKCLYTTREPMQTIVFDDLTQYGYKLASRQHGLDEQHCVVLLRKLGKFHATSMVLLEKVSRTREWENCGVSYGFGTDLTGYRLLFLCWQKKTSPTPQSDSLISQKVRNKLDKLGRESNLTLRCIAGHLRSLPKGVVRRSTTLKEF